MTAYYRVCDNCGREVDTSHEPNCPDIDSGVVCVAAPIAPAAHRAEVHSLRAQLAEAQKVNKAAREMFDSLAGFQITRPKGGGKTRVSAAYRRLGEAFGFWPDAVASSLVKGDSDGA